MGGPGEGMEEVDWEAYKASRVPRYGATLGQGPEGPTFVGPYDVVWKRASDGEEEDEEDDDENEEDREDEEGNEEGNEEEEGRVEETGEPVRDTIRWANDRLEVKMGNVWVAASF